MKKSTKYRITLLYMLFHLKIFLFFHQRVLEFILQAEHCGRCCEFEKRRISVHKELRFIINNRVASLINQIQMVYHILNQDWPLDLINSLKKFFILKWYILESLETFWTTQGFTDEAQFMLRCVHVLTIAHKWSEVQLNPIVKKKVCTL